MNTIKITKNDEGKRLDKFLISYYDVPFSHVKKSLRKKDVKINGTRIKDGATRLKEGDVVVTYFKFVSEPKGRYRKLKQEFTVVYEDNNLLVVNKPSGLDIDSGDNNLKEQVLYYLDQSGKIPEDTSFEPANLHRLDKRTSGCVMFALGYETLRIIQDVITDKNIITKEYLGVVQGIIEEGLTVDKPLKKDDSIEKMVPVNKGKVAITHIEPIVNDGHHTLLRITIETGRKHQIRAHMAYIGHPIIGDNKYGNTFGTMNLHAHKIKFNNFEGTLEYLNGVEVVAPKPGHFII
jgi:23S rRNA pseudouridine955/2504/2580 synthase